MLHPGLAKPVIDQQYHPAILLGADYAAGRLHDFLQAGIQVGVVVTIAKDRRHALFHLLIDRVELRQPQGGDERADQA